MKWLNFVLFSTLVTAALHTREMMSVTRVRSTGLRTISRHAGATNSSVTMLSTCEDNYTIRCFLFYIKTRTPLVRLSILRITQQCAHIIVLSTTAKKEKMKKKKKKRSKDNHFRR